MLPGVVLMPARAPWGLPVVVAGKRLSDECLTPRQHFPVARIYVKLCEVGPGSAMAADMEDDALALKKFKIEKKRLLLDEEKARFDARFWHRNFGTMTTFAVAFLGLVLSVAQVWVAYVQKDRDALQREHEVAIAQIQKQRELESQERRDLREFVSKNDGQIFSADSAARDRMKKLMLATFTPYIVQPVFDSLFAISAPAQQGTWAQARGEAANLAIQQAQPLVYVHYQDKRDSGLADGVAKLLADAGYRVPAKELVVQQTKGDVRFFHSDEKDQADRIAGLVRDYLKKQGRDQEMTPLFAGRTFPNVPRGLFEVWIPMNPSGG